ncbi:MAG: hypothetical protein KC547_01620 [Anaerolineae bacterium]|nr:hypothetical protein [Anaerolineae bacterium]MCA9909538.1 hypothetical protein [Anaerolineae bacterium]
MHSPVECIDAGVFLVQYSDPLTFDEVADVVETFKQLRDEYGLDQYVTISDLSNCKNPPSDITNARQMVVQDKRMIGAVIVKAPLLAQIIGRIVRRVTPVDIIDVDTIDEGRAVAKKLLAGESVNSSL